jgi:biopolymer transport protein TolR
MGFSSNQGGKSRVVVSEINVTPLVDVMLVLLIMFMVTTPLMQQGLNIDLPKTSPSGMEVNEDPFDINIIDNSKIMIGETPIQMNNLRTKLTAIFAQRKNKQVYIRANKNVDYGTVAEVLAEVRGAGISSVGLLTEIKK